MKKIYTRLTVAVLAVITTFSFQEIKAQSICPTTGGGQKVFHVQTTNAGGQPVNMVYVENFIPNARLSLFQSGTPPIYFNNDFTNAAGIGKVIYNPATINPAQIESCVTEGCCRVSVPAIDACPTGASILHIKYPANLEDDNDLNDEPLCAVYVQNSLPGATVRLFDPLQQVIPTSSNTGAVTDFDGFVCYIYPCDRLPATVTVCNATQCCSQPVPAASALPIKLTSFTARLNGTTVALNWASSLEIGSKKFIIEKSNDGRNYTAIGEVGAAGTTTLKKSYAFDDKNFGASGTAFYRLKQVDIDDKHEYSKVVYVNSRNDQGIITRVFPNPFKSDIQLIGINSAELNRRNVRIFSITGQEVNYKITGANAIALDENAPSGLYILKLKNQQIKLIKE